VLKGDYLTQLARFEVDAIVWRTPAETLAWAQTDSSSFATPLVHLLRRPSVRSALGLAA